MSDARIKVKDFFVKCCNCCWNKHSGQKSKHEPNHKRTSKLKAERLDQPVREIIQLQEQKLVDKDQQTANESFDVIQTHLKEVEQTKEPLSTLVGDSNDSPELIDPKGMESAKGLDQSSANDGGCKPPMDDHESMRSLRRSHSVLNIPKTRDSKTASAPGVVRLVDPNLSGANKPLSMAERSHARIRDFRPFWGSDVKEGMTGLKNLGNTCYMNSILQCLSNLKELANYFMNKEHLNSLTCGDIAVEFSEVLWALWCGQYKSIAPVDFKKAIGRRRICFKGNDQQDAFEFLATLIDLLHNDISQVCLPEQSLDAAEISSEFENGQSVIRDLFYGERCSTLICNSCSWTSVKFEPVFELALQLPAGRRLTLDQCIQNYLEPETVSYTCPRCREERYCVKKFDIVHLPKILTIQLIRFSADGIRKNNAFVDFDLSDVDFGKFVSAFDGRKSNRYRSYNLAAVCNHRGGIGGGHYTAHCLSSLTEQWAEFNDSMVTELPPSMVVTQQAYVIFFTAQVSLA